MNFDAVRFFIEYRKRFGAIKLPATVDNLKYILSQNEKYNVNLNQLAYILATAYHETGYDFIPKYEYGKAEYFIKKYWHNSKVAKWLGNDDAKDAFDCRGRGLVQITGEDNYIKFGIRDNPDKALQIETATDILYRGMMNGMFSGKKLTSYVNDTDCYFISARKVVNGSDKAEKIAAHAANFVDILKSSQIN